MRGVWWLALLGEGVGRAAIINRQIIRRIIVSMALGRESAMSWPHFLFAGKKGYGVAHIECPGNPAISCLLVLSIFLVGGSEVPRVDDWKCRGRWGPTGQQRFAVCHRVSDQLCLPVDLLGLLGGLW